MKIKGNKTGSISSIFNVLLMMMMLIILWAYNTEIDQVVRAQGEVEPATKIEYIQARYPGSVESVAVEIGSEVKEGDVVATLDVSDVEILKAGVEKKISLLNEEIGIFEKLVVRGLEPRIKLIALGHKKAELEEKLARYELQLSNSTIRANKTGVVSALHTTGAGQVLKGGENLLEIVPQASHHLIKLKINPKDIAKVSVGQKVRVSFVAYEFGRYGAMDAKITKIAQNSTETKESIYYEAWAKTEGDTFKKGNYKPKLMPGMQAQIDVLADKRTIAEYVLSPLKRGASNAFSE